MLNIGPQELILVLIIALVVVGPQRLPELGRTIGKFMREFRKIQDDVKDTLKFDLGDDPEPYVRPKTTPRTPPTPHANGPRSNGEVAPEAAPSTAVPAEDATEPAPDGPTPGADGSGTPIEPDPRAAE